MLENGDIELDDIQVVEVTGRKHRDKIPKAKKSSCQCSSLRLTTLLIVISIAVVVLVFLVVGVILMFDSLEQLDVAYSNTSVNRLGMMIITDMEKMRKYIQLNGFGSDSGNTLKTYSLYKKGLATEEEYLTALEGFNSSTVFTQDFYTGKVAFNSGAENNFISLLDINFETLPKASWFAPGDSTELVGQVLATPPKIKPESYKNIKALEPDATDWMTLYVPDEGDTSPMMVCFAEVKVSGDDELYGYLVYGRSIFPRLVNAGSYVDDVPTCITIENGLEEADKWDDVDKQAFEDVKAGTLAVGADAYLGVASFVKRPNETVVNMPGRSCPSVSLFNSTAELMVAYMKFCGMDPNKYGDRNCMKIRVDRPTSFVEEGTMPIVYISVEVVGMMIVICIIFIIFLDCVVLRRIESLSKVIRTQTRGHAKAQEEDESSVSIASVRVGGDEENTTEARGKSGRSSKGKSGTSTSGTNTTSDSSGGAAAPGQGKVISAHDEIGNLKRAMEQNAVGLRKRLEAVNDTIKLEQQRAVHHKQAMQLLNLWCGRKDFFPGLRPNAMQLRYEPTRNLDDILTNSLALEYLKTHCDNDRTVENLWFILDVAWLEELEAAEDEEKSADKRAQLHDVAVCAAKTIVQRYIAKNAPQQINISAGTYKKLREVGERYSRMMFREAVSEVKLMLNTDILPRFQKTSSYSAMSETLYVDSAGGGNESSSDMSDETVSTAGSILTDTEEEGGVGRVFAKTFKNLHTAFDVGHYETSSSGGSAHALPQAGDDDLNSSADDSSNESSEKEPPPKISDEKKEEEKKEKKEEEKKEPEEKEEQPIKEKNESSDSSSEAVSSDSLSASSSSSSDSSTGISSESE